jgi:anhydro-N-acetylmuramic acid kinase
MDRIKNKLSEITISTTEKYGISPDALEAVSFAILANETIHGNPSNLPSVTGAKRKVILGKIVL